MLNVSAPHQQRVVPKTSYQIESVIEYLVTLCKKVNECQEEVFSDPNAIPCQLLRLDIAVVKGMEGCYKTTIFNRLRIKLLAYYDNIPEPISKIFTEEGLSLTGE